jgi:hypothetical protein
LTDIEQRLNRMKSFIETDEYKKFNNKFLEGMSRSERKNYERKEEKLKQCIKSLTPMQLELIEQRAEMRARELADNKIDEFKDTLDRCMTAQFILSLPDKSWDEIDDFIDGLAVLVEEDVTKILELKKECKGDQDIMNKTMQKCENEVKAKCEELLDKGLNQKKSIDVLISQFPMLSKSMLTNAYKKLKSDWDKLHKEEVDPDVKEALESISDIIDGDDEKSVDKIIKESDEYVKQAEKEEQHPKVVCDGNSCRIEPVQEIKEEIVMKETKGLKVLSMTLQGENGNYEVSDTKGVLLVNDDNSIFFENLEQLEEWTNEFKQVFAMAK